MLWNEISEIGCRAHCNLAPRIADAEDSCAIASARFRGFFEPGALDLSNRPAGDIRPVLVLCKMLIKDMNYWNNRQI
jgi:hypothetical protein